MRMGQRKRYAWAAEAVNYLVQTLGLEPERIAGFCWLHEPQLPFRSSLRCRRRRQPASAVRHSETVSVTLHAALQGPGRDRRMTVGPPGYWTNRRAAFRRDLSSWDSNNEPSGERGAIQGRDGSPSAHGSCVDASNRWRPPSDISKRSRNTAYRCSEWDVTDGGQDAWQGYRTNHRDPPRSVPSPATSRRRRRGEFTGANSLDPRRQKGGVFCLEVSWEASEASFRTLC